MMHHTDRTLFLASLLLPSLSHSALPTTNAPGTYEIIVCKEGCAFSDMRNVFVKGTVVLDGRRFPTGDVRQIESSFIGPNEEFRACFSLTVLRNADSYAAFGGAGPTSWRMTDGAIEFLTFRSPDAGYSVNVTMNGGGFAGTGISWGVGAADSHFTNDIVIGKRIGPPDLEKRACR